MENHRIVGHWDGSSEPLNPLGIATYGYVVRRGEDVLHQDHGLAAEPFTNEATNNVAEYVGLVRLLDWLVRNDHTRSVVRLFGDSKLIISQVVGKWKVNTEHLQPFHRMAREYVAMFQDIQIAWVPREENRDADALTHKAYEEYLDANPAAALKLPLASESQL